MRRASLFILAAAAFVSPVLAFAAPASISINTNIPGFQDVSTVGPCGWIANFYTFALIVAGILAFGAVVYGGIKYSASAGNPSSQSEGRAWIWSALLGILLLAGAWLILNTIDPTLTKCSLPSLSSLPAGAGTSNPISGGAVGTGSSGGGGASGDWTQDTCASGPCATLPDCTQSYRVNCGGAQPMVDTLTCMQNIDPSFSVSEGFPPVVAHTSAGHNDGCSVDLIVPNGCSGVTALQAAAAQCGATSLNEYSNCGGKTYGTTTGDNVHINSKPGGGC